MKKRLLKGLLLTTTATFAIGAGFANGEAKILLDQENKKILIQNGDQLSSIDDFSGSQILPLKTPWMSNPQIPTAPAKPQTPSSTEKKEEKPEAVSVDPALHEELASGSELEKAIYRMHKNGLTSFDTVETYRAKDPLLREEAAKIIAQAYLKLGYPQETKNQNCEFSDQEQFNSSLADFVKKSCQYGIFRGSSGAFRPHNQLTKAEALTVLMRIFEGTTSNESLTPRWTMYFVKARAIGLTNESNVTTLDKIITREEIALLIYRFKKLILNQEAFATAKVQLANVNQNPTSFLQNQAEEAKKNEKSDNPNSVNQPNNALLNLLSGSKDSSSSLSILNNPEISEAMHRMRESKLTSATDISTYRAFAPLTREQAAKMLVEFAKLQHFSGLQTTAGNCSFKDSNKADPSLKGSIQEACQLGLMKGGNGLFNPKTTIAKSEFLALLIRLSEGKHLDESQTPRWSNYFYKAKDLGLVSNDDALSLENPMTRYEAALIFYRFRIKQKILNNLNTNQLKNEFISTMRNTDGSLMQIDEKIYAVSIDTNLLKNQFFQEGFIEILGQRYRLKKTNLTSFDIGNESFVRYGDVIAVSDEKRLGSLNLIVSNSNIIDGSLRLLAEAKTWKIRPDSKTTARYQLISQ